MNVYCPNDKTHKLWSDDVFCTTCGAKLKKMRLTCQECNRRQYPPLGKEDSDVKYCAYCGSSKLTTIEES